MKYPLTRIGALMVLALLLAMPLFARDASLMQVTFLDVHQGDCVIIRTAQKTIMIDAGDDNRNAAQAYIIPYLKKEGIKHIDQAVISHPHRDHFGGFIELIKHFSFGEFVYSNDTNVSSESGASGNDAIYYTQMLDLIKQKNINYRRLKVGEMLDWGTGIKSEVLFTDDGSFGDIGKNANDMSIIIKATAGKISYLFTGDAEKKAESIAIERAGKKLSSTVLKSGHHGSKTSSNHAFMDMVQPKYGVISAGKGNSFGHPTQTVLDIYDYYKMSVFRTDTDGTIESYTDGQNVTFVTNNTPIKITAAPKIISITPNSATLQWTTNRAATSKVEYGLGTTKVINKKKAFDHTVKVHTVTLTGLKPNTQYNFIAISTDPRESEKFAKAEGTFRTPVGDGVPLPKILTMNTDVDQTYMKTPFKVIVPVKNAATKPSDVTTVEIYHSAIDSSNLIDKYSFGKIGAGETMQVSVPTQIDWLGVVEIIAILKQGNTIIDTASLNLDLKPKTIIVDCAHGNKDYFTGKFAGMKMDLFQNLGYQMKSISKPFTATSFKDAFAVLIPSPSKDYTATEINALKKYSANGGAIMLFSCSDYRNLSNPLFLNKILKATGSKIRFNDDQICDPDNNIGPPWRFFVTNFPSPAITAKNMKKLLVNSASTLLDDKNKPLKGSANVFLLATGDENTYSIESDGKNDAPFLYATSTTSIPAPLAAAQDLGNGRIAAIGESFYTDSYYQNPAGLSTIEFNRNIIAWLTAAKNRSIGSIVRSIAELDSEPDPEIKADRYQALSDSLLKRIRNEVTRNTAVFYDVNEEVSNYSGDTIDALKRQLNDVYRFERLHDDDDY